MSDRFTRTAYAVRTGNDGRVTYLASTDSDEATDGWIIEKGAWRLEEMSPDMPLLYAHQHTIPPVGKVLRASKDLRGLVCEVEFHQITELSRDAYELVKRNVLNACSVGFRILKTNGNRVTHAKLDELSVVAIGADPNALAIARSAYGRDAQTVQLQPDEYGLIGGYNPDNWGRWDDADEAEIALMLGGVIERFDQRHPDIVAKLAKR